MKKRSLFFFLIVTLIQTGFFIYGVVNGPVVTKDSAEYLHQAENIKTRHTWYCGDLNQPVIPELYSQRPPLYGTFLLLATSVSKNYIAILLLQSLLCLVNFFLAVHILRKLTGDNFNNYLLLIPLLFFPSQFIYTNAIMSELLLQSTLMLALWWMIKFNDSGKSTYFLLYQLFLTLAVLTKPVFIVFPIVSMAYFLLRKKVILPLSTILLFHFIPVIIVLAASWVNYSHTGYFEYSSIGRKLAINYHARYATAFADGDSIAIAEIEKVEYLAKRTSSYAEKAGSIQSGANRLITQHAFSYIYLSAKGVLLFFIDHSRYDISLFTGHPVPENTSGLASSYKLNGIAGLSDYLKKQQPIFLLYLMISMLFNLYLLAGLFRFAFLKEVAKPYRSMLLLFILYLALLTGMTGTTRFRMPVYLMLLIANGCVWHYSYFLFRKRSASDAE